MINEIEYVQDAMQANIAEAARFLKLLDPQADHFTFQTFNDEKKSKDKTLTRILNGTLDQHAAVLSQLNAQGAGVFVTINQTDLRGRTAENVVAVRHFFVDTDGAPHKPILSTARDSGVLPSCVVESSPGNYHIYWKAACDLADFRAVQTALISKFGTDKSVHDLPRVMRLPGFYHQKRANGVYKNACGPYLVSIRAANENADFYTPDEMIEGLGLAPPQAAELSMALNHAVAAALKSSPPPETDQEVSRINAMLKFIPADCDRAMWRNIVWAIASTGWQSAEDLAKQWSMTAPDKYTEEEFDKVWHSFNPAGGIGLGTLFHYAEEAGWRASGVVTQADTAPDDTSGDIKNGKSFSNMFRDKLLFVHETGDVLKFEVSTGWVQALPGEADRAGKEVVARMRAFAAEQWKLMPHDPENKSLMKHVDRSSTEQRISAMINMAQSEPGMTVRLCELDADPMLLGVANGVLDLRTCELMCPTPPLHITKRCPVAFDPGATAPILEAFITRITQSDPPLAKFLQRLAGYMLTGEVNEQCFAFLYGLGRNGKTTYAELLFWLLGDYAVVLPTATLMMGKRDPGACSPDLMLLKGRRLALASELEESARFAEAAIKSMTGGDTMTARNPYGTFASWTPTHKLMIVGNHRPVISGGDHGIWRRVRLIPFSEIISDSECDSTLPEKLRTEGAGVLNWALAGLRNWQHQELNPPASVKAAVAAYHSDMDILGEWLDDQTEADPSARTETAVLYRAYSRWAKDSGWTRPMTRNSFGRRLTDRGITTSKASNGNKCANGIRLNAEGQRAADCFI